MHTQYGVFRVKTSYGQRAVHQEYTTFMAAKKRKNAIVARWNARRSFMIDGLEPRWLLSSNPSVNTVNPVAGATGVALNQPITASVNLPNGALNANTVIGANVTLYPTGLSSNND